MPTQKSGLGKGIDSLLPQNFDRSILLDESERIQKIDIGQIETNKNQPRQNFDSASMKELTSSVKEHGILQPIILAPDTSGTKKYMIIAGERRWRAAKTAGLKVIPAIVRTLKDLQRLEIAIVENVQRVDLSPLEQATSIERLRHQFNISYVNIAKRLGKAESTIQNTARLLLLPRECQQALNNKDITEGHARSLVALNNDPDKQKLLLDNIKKYHWSVRQAEQFVVGAKKENKTVSELQNHMSKETMETQMLSRTLSAPVTIKRMAKGGKLEIGFSSDENLKEIIDKLLM
ncbi:MAG TPA: ParB/RepB/Spo0J family partition protein [Candidatus Saccharimonadia bacterium]|nr:ParB/RepB/Spo0J family partition protein [Candidatus Saccharimonadia bacterium]